MKILLSAIIIWAVFGNAYSQVYDTIYYKGYEKVSDKLNYNYYRIIKRTGDLTFYGTDYYNGDSLRATYTMVLKKNLNVTSDNINKLIQKKKLLMHGRCRYYTRDSIVNGEEIYDYGKITFGPVRYINGDTVYVNVDQLPMFNNGKPNEFGEYIAQALKYPEEAMNKNIYGKVYVQFTIGKSGEVKYVTVLRGVDPLLDSEAVRIIKNSPGWSPGMLKGKPVNVLFTIPINFKVE